MKKFLSTLLVVVLCMTFLPTTALAETASPDLDTEHVCDYDDCTLLGNQYSLDEYLSKLNSGEIQPHDVQSHITYDTPDSSSSDETGIAPRNIACLLGHDWTTWSAWKTTRIIHGSKCGTNACPADMERGRACKRSNCYAVQMETSVVFVYC